MVQIQNCRLCHSENFEVFLKLGTMPLAGNFLKKEDVGKENAYPLDVCFCKNCGSVQVLEMIPRDTFFRDYRYLSSVTAKSVLEHFKTYASEIKERFLPNGGFVLEVACNDGILLEPLKNLELNVLGVDPAKNITKIAKGKGLDVIDDYFGLDLSKQILEKYDKANVIVGNAVFAHVDDLNDILLGVKNLLKDDGVFIFEVNVMIGDGTIIKSGSKIIGPVIIGKNCLIDNSVFVGPNTSIGDNTKLSQCTIRNSIIMNDCEIYCNVTIKNSIVSSNSKILKMEPSSIEKVFLLGEGTQIKL